MIVFRFLPILGAFALGAAVSWWVAHPSAVVVATEGPVAIPRISPADRALVVELADPTEEHSMGIPPASATVPKSHPNAGQKRASAS